MMRVALACVAGGFLALATPATSAGFDAALRDFAQDISGGDAQIAAQVEQIIANPPSETEEVGFYGVASEPANARKFRATIFRLSEAEFVFGFEDKYINEMVPVLQDSRWIAADQKGDTFLEKIETLLMGGDDPGAASAQLLADGFAAHRAAIEEAADRAGHALLYVDLPLGDTFHILRTTPEVADKWRGAVFAETEFHAFAVTDPNWEVYYLFLASSVLSLPDVAPYTAPPAGGRRSLVSLGYSDD